LLTAGHFSLYSIIGHRPQQQPVSRHGYSLSADQPTIIITTKIV